MAGAGRSRRRRRGSPPATARLALLVAVATMAGVAAEGKAVRVGEPHRRSMLANGLGSAPPMGWVPSFDSKHRAPSFFFPRFCSSRDLWCVVRAPSILAHGVDP